MSKKIEWTKELSAVKSDDFTFTVPYHATLGEAADVAVFVRANHKADKKTGTPGLADGNLPLAIADEIDSLVESVMWAQRDYRKAMSPKADTTKLDRARFIIDEMGAVLEYVLDDGVEDEIDQRFAKFVAAHKDAPDSPTRSRSSSTSTRRTPICIVTTSTGLFMRIHAAISVVRAARRPA